MVVQLLAINDFHGNLEPRSGSNGQINATAVVVAALAGAAAIIPAGRR